MQYAAESVAPRPAVALLKARPCTAASVGPRHGVQPIPKRAPSAGAPARPRDGSHRTSTAGWPP